MSDRAVIIGVMGGTECSEEEYRWSREVGALVAEKKGVLLCGGRTGVMEAAARGCHEQGGLVIGVLPGKSRADSTPNLYVHIPIFTGMGDGRNIINVLSSDAIIAIGGKWGTLSEIALALKNEKPTILLHSWSELPGVIHADSPRDAVDRAFSLLS